ncbi:MAG: efflux RND transporter periplasmic adaptor subunit [Pirellulales bacterium]|nr:efflux RND transporter periplasmic adaptor subunit [Pirellulales bacterium]
MKSRGSVPWRRVLSTVGLAVAGIAILVGAVVVATKAVTIQWNRRIEPAETSLPERKLAPGDRTDKVHEVSKEYFEEAVGTLRAASRTEISARVMAPIERMRVRAGQAVAEGDELVVLDRRAIETQRSQVEASLVAAEAAANQAKTHYDRVASLLESNAISREAFDDAKAKLEVAQANLNHARQTLAEADVGLTYTVIRAPKSGTVVDRLAEEGDMARPGQPLLVLYDPTSLRLEVPVMENLAGKIHTGDKLAVVIDATGKTVTATVDEVVPQAEAASRSFLVKAALPKSEGLFEGMFGRLKIPAGVRLHLCLATAAIERIGQLEMVDVVGPDGRLQRRMIKTGRLGMPGKVEVLSGLKAGETVRLRPENASSKEPTGGH